MKCEVRDAHEILQQREERKRKLIENDWEYQREERKRKLIQAAPRRGGLKVHGQIKLRNVLRKLEKGQVTLKLLLVEADEETIKENIPEASRAKCLDAFSTASNICLRINQAISANEGQNVEEKFSAAKKSITRITKMINLLGSTVNALRTA